MNVFFFSSITIHVATFKELNPRSLEECQIDTPRLFLALNFRCFDQLSKALAQLFFVRSHIF